MKAFQHLTLLITLAAGGVLALPSVAEDVTGLTTITSGTDVFTGYNVENESGIEARCSGTRLPKSDCDPGKCQCAGNYGCWGCNGGRVQCQPGPGSGVCWT
ncbi:Uu.00g038590.m01.CDS01 [Anthostomella pinea]|uniref:Uu.00g038590.m01.CDS01 n=1 Tax=Anthostomella pinea TaxID=933095 RepID=A0AAI8V9V7_9PEZI|nr:Uu.00g038590.m01.CDS01 [Anthostomella pinea]